MRFFGSFEQFHCEFSTVRPLWSHLDQSLEHISEINAKSGQKVSVKKVIILTFFALFAKGVKTILNSCSQMLSLHGECFCCLISFKNGVASTWVLLDQFKQCGTLCKINGARLLRWWKHFKQLPSLISTFRHFSISVLLFRPSWVSQFWPVCSVNFGRSIYSP